MSTGRPSREEQRALLEALAALDDASASVGRDLVQLLLGLHGDALRRLVELVAGTEGGAALLSQLAADRQIRGLLLLYDLHPQALDARVHEALDGLRAHLGATGIGIERITLEGGKLAVELRCPRAHIHGLPSAESLRRDIEDAVFDLAPDLDSIEIRGLPVPTAFVPLSGLRRRRNGADGPAVPAKS